MYLVIDLIKHEIANLVHKHTSKDITFDNYFFLCLFTVIISFCEVGV